MTDSAQTRPPGPLDVGDPAPAILLPNQHGETVSPTQDSLAGTPSILALYPSVADPTAVRELGCFRDHFDAITEHGARLFVVSRDPVASLAQLGAQEAYPFMLLSDEKGTAFKSLGLLGQDGNHGAACYVLDSNYRIVASAGSNGVDSQAGQVLAVLQESFESPACLALDHHSPILIMPRLVTRQFCQYLLDLWQQEEGRATTPNGESAALGDLIIRNDANGSIRQYLVHDKEALSYLGYAINRRLMPEMMKAFQTKISQREGVVVTCYAGEDGGFLAPHRDNHHEKTRHRRFTLSVVLNGGAYEGGELRFKEYGAHLYDFEPGTGVVWAAGLLHEVRPVTKGRRFVTGTHLFGE